MIALAALACWIGGLVLLTISPFAGSIVAAGGFVLAGVAMRTRDSLETLFGMMMLFVLVIGALRFIAWLIPG